MIKSRQQLNMHFDRVTKGWRRSTVLVHDQQHLAPATNANRALPNQKPVPTTA